MALVTKVFSINITPGEMPPTIHVSEYDVGRAYNVTFIGENGNAFEIPTGTTATVEGTLNGTIGFTTSATISNNQISFALTESMTAYSGKAWCKIKLTLNDEPIQTCAFILAVDRAGVEAKTVIGAPGFEEQIADAVNDWLDEHDIVQIEVDPTLTKSGEAADAKAVGDVFDAIEVGGNTPISFSAGSINSDGKTNAESTVRARSDFIQMRSGETLTQSASGYLWYMYRFDSQQNLLGHSSAWATGNVTFSETGYFRLLLKKSNESAFAQADIDALNDSGFSVGGSYNKIPIIDATLTHEGQAADAAAVGEALANIPSGGSGLTNAVKQALLACFQNVAWANANGLTYYNALISAFTEDEGGGGGSALYPMETGSKTFSNGMVVSVSNGNHVDITGLKQGEQIWNLSDVTSNNSDSSLSANGSAVNNLATTMFSIPSCSRVEIKILNITATRTDVFGAQTGGGKQLVLNMRKAGSSSAGFSSLIYPANSNDTLELTTTLSESLDLSCVYMYANGTRGDHTVDISFDLSVYVDGTRWI